MAARATAAELEQMARAVATVKGEQEKAEAWAAVTRASWFVTDAQRASLKAIQDNRNLFDQWSKVWRTWAENGKEPDGVHDYPVAHWLRIGADLASALKTYTGGLYDGSVFAVVANTASATTAQIAQGAASVVETIAAPSLGLKVAAGIVGVVLVLGAAGYAVRAVR